MLHSNEALSAKQPKQEKQDKQKSALTVSAKTIEELETACQADPRNDLEIMVKTICLRPELLASSDLEKIKYRLTIPRSKIREEIFRRFLMWKVGEFKRDNFSAWLANTPLMGELFRKDQSLSDMVPALTQGGVGLDFLTPQLLKKVIDDDWSLTLDESTMLLLLDNQFGDALNNHLQRDQTTTSEWHYKAGRLCLEVWLFQDPSEKMLKSAASYFEQCKASSRWYEESRILLNEIRSRISTD
ncbi:MAG: hypothetical protein HQM10_14900 [Candidatus Riflebacteria bacterium]|nr:hypothetical protein [Candidatus Riflebacteria bacterium]